MQLPKRAAKAYEAASRTRSLREQEADVFRHVAVTTKAARDSGPLARVRALADNRLLWTTVSDMMRDPGNALPETTRAGIVSIAKSVQRETDQETPDFEFLVSVNETVMAGLLGKP